MKHDDQISSGKKHSNNDMKHDDKMDKKVKHENNDKKHVMRISAVARSTMTINTTKRRLGTTLRFMTTT